MEVLELLREEFQIAAEQFLYHALIVMIEEFPQVVGVTHESDDPEVNEKLWAQVVMAASVTFFTGVITETWAFKLPAGLAFSIQEGSVFVMPYGPHDWVLSDLQPILEASEDLEEEGIAHHIENTGAYWQGSVLTRDQLHAQLSVQVDKLIKSGGSYVKHGNFRKHKSLIMSFYNKENPHDANSST
jgi:hypothetical protein